MSSQVRYIDVGLNLTDPVFRGLHRGRRKHRDDLLDVIGRAKAAGVQSAVLTGGSLHESSEALALAEELGFFATVGCHPTRSSQFDSFKGGPEAYLERLDQLIASHLTGKGRCVAVGECGLDYDRLHFSSAETQRKHFRSQLALAKKYHLPLFLHVRAAHEDFVTILREEGFGEDGGRAVGGRGGVVHSFTGRTKEMKELVAMGFHVSVNGCSMKTDCPKTYRFEVSVLVSSLSVPNWLVGDPEGQAGKKTGCIGLASDHFLQEVNKADKGIRGSGKRVGLWRDPRPVWRG